MIKIFQLIVIIFFLSMNLTYTKENVGIYEKIDLFGEVLDKIKK